MNVVAFSHPVPGSGGRQTEYLAIPHASPVLFAARWARDGAREERIRAFAYLATRRVR